MPRRNHFKLSQRKRYKSRGYKNPYLQDRGRFNIKWIGISIGGVILVIITIMLLLSHPMFAITKVNIEGVEYIDRSRLESTIFDYMLGSKYLVFNHKNRFLFSSDELSKKLLNAFALASIEIGLREGEVYITLKERTSNLLWKTNGKLYVVDLEGVVAREVKEDQDEILQHANLAELPVFIDVNDIEVDVGSSVLTREEVDQAFAFLDALESAGIGQEYIEIDRIAGKWVRVMTSEGFSVLIDLTGDTRKQFNNLMVVLNNKVEDPSTLDYIDLRFGDKVYYK